MEITFPIYEQEDKDHSYRTIDGLGFLTDDIVGKSGPPGRESIGCVPSLYLLL